MGNDLLLVLGIILFIFIAWVYTGGPSRPISFAGPYITPITNVGDTQQGYGSTSSNSFWGSVKSTFSSGGAGTYYGGSAQYGNETNSADGSYYQHMSEVPAGIRSPYAGKIHLEGGNASATSVSQEYLEVYSDSGASSISISGWRLVSEKTGAHVIIPYGKLIALENSSLSSIVLNSGDHAILSTGTSPAGDSFKESKCTGYLNTRNQYSPSLSNGNCPAPLDELGKFYGGTASDYDRCAPYVNSVSSCQAPHYDDPDSIPNSCDDFIEGYLSYGGCVDHHQNDSNFYGTTWRVFFGESRELWRSSNDTIRLVDQNNKTVDLYSY